MKLRIEGNKICFRLDYPELEQLLDHGEIQQITKLPQGSLTYRIVVLPAGSAPAFADDDGFTPSLSLSLARDMLEAHKKALPSLKGILCDFATADGGSIEVALEVNLKKKLKHSLK